MSNRESGTIRVDGSGGWALAWDFEGPCASLRAADALAAGAIDRVPPNLDEAQVLLLATRVRTLAHTRQLRSLLDG